MSFHEIKGLLILSIFVLYCGYGLINTVRRKYAAKYRRVYAYSIPFIVGNSIAMLSLLCLPFFYSHYIEYAIWCFLGLFLGIIIASCGNCMLSKHKGEVIQYQKLLADIKENVLWLVLMAALLIWREYFSK